MIKNIYLCISAERLQTFFIEKYKINPENILDEIKQLLDCNFCNNIDKTENDVINICMRKIKQGHGKLCSLHCPERIKKRNNIKNINRKKRKLSNSVPSFEISDSNIVDEKINILSDQHITPITDGVKDSYNIDKESILKKSSESNICTDNEDELKQFVTENTINSNILEKEEYGNSEVKHNDERYLENEIHNDTPLIFGVNEYQSKRNINEKMTTKDVQVFNNKFLYAISKEKLCKTYYHFFLDFVDDLKHITNDKDISDISIEYIMNLKSFYEEIGIDLTKDYVYEILDFANDVGCQKLFNHFITFFNFNRSYMFTPAIKIIIKDIKDLFCRYNFNIST